MFLILIPTYFTDYTDDNTPFTVRGNITNVIKAIEGVRENFVNWFSNKEKKLNTDKCHPFLNIQEPNILKICDLHISNSLSEKHLGITFYCKIRLNKHTNMFVKKHYRC